MLNGIFIALIIGAILTAGFTGQMEAVFQASIESAKAAVTIAIGLIGMMALWLGLMAVVRESGGLAAITRMLAPVMRRLFPDVPPDHPAMGAMILNMASNMLGLGNAATPFGLKAMQELDKLNRHKGVATDSMALFLAINTSGVAVLPLGVIAIRAEMGSLNAGGILVPSILATMCSTIVAVTIAKLLQKRRRFAVERQDGASQTEGPQEAALMPDIKGLDEAQDVASIRRTASVPRAWIGLAVLVLFLASGVASGMQQAPDATSSDILRHFLNFWLLPALMGGILMLGFVYNVKVYDTVVQGAKEGFQIAVMIIPFLVAIIVAVGMFRASGALDLLIALVQPVTSAVGIPAETLPMALVRPLSGSGAMGVMVETMQSYGPDSLVGYIVSVVNGSTETTFYVLAVYFGSVQVRATRHTLAACLAADAVGFLAAVAWCRLLLA